MRMTYLLAAFLALPILAQPPIGSLDNLPDPRAMPAAQLEVPKPKLQTFSLPNGIRVLFLEDHELPVVSLYSAFKAGSLEDPADKAGLAAMTATLLRSGGTQAFTAEQLNEKLESLAAHVEFSASQEHSGGGLHCFKKDLPEVLSLYAGMLRTPRFKAERVDFVRNQILSSLQQQEDQPIQVAVRDITRLLFNGKGPGNPPTKASVGRISEADLRTFARTWFVPSNMVVGITGDLTQAEAKEQLRKALGDWPKGACPAPARSSEPTQAAPGAYLLSKAKLNQSVVIAGMLGFRDNDPDQMALEAAFTVLGGGELGNRLFNTIRTEKGLAYAAGCDITWPQSVDGVFFSYAITKTESTAKAAVLMREECAKLASGGITAQEWENTCRSLTNKEVFANATSQDILGSAVSLSLFGLPLDTRAKHLEKLQSLTLAQVNDALKRRFKPENLRFFILGDPEGFGSDKLDALGPVQAIQP